MKIEKIMKFPQIDKPGSEAEGERQTTFGDYILETMISGSGDQKIRT